jgi:hypothetical protein
MTGSHEVRGSIPLGSTNNLNKLGAANELPLVVLWALGYAYNRQSKAMKLYNHFSQSFSNFLCCSLNCRANADQMHRL